MGGLGKMDPFSRMVRDLFFKLLEAGMIAWGKWRHERRARKR